jgi:hypothetical protein
VRPSPATDDESAIIDPSSSRVRHSTATVIPRLPQMSFGTFLLPLDRAASCPSWVQPVDPSLLA